MTPTARGSRTTPPKVSRVVSLVRPPRCARRARGRRRAGSRLPRAGGEPTRSSAVTDIDREDDDGVPSSGRGRGRKPGVERAPRGDGPSPCARPAAPEPGGDSRKRAGRPRPGGPGRRFGPCRPAAQHQAPRPVRRKQDQEHPEDDAEARARACPSRSASQDGGTHRARPGARERRLAGTMPTMSTSRGPEAGSLEFRVRRAPGRTGSPTAPPRCERSRRRGSAWSRACSPTGFSTWP